MSRNFLVVFATAALLLGGCQTNFKPMQMPLKPAATSAASIKQVQAAATVAGNQPGIATLASNANVLIKQMRHVQWLQLQNFTTGAVEHDYTPSMNAALALVPALWKLEYDARTLYFLVREAPPELSAEGMALAKQGFSYADLSATVLALDLGYPISGIEWNAAYLSGEHHHEADMNAYTAQLMAAAQKFDAFAQRFAKQLATVQASGDTVAPLRPLNLIATHRMTVSVVGKASKDDRDHLAAALQEAAAKMPPLPQDVTLTVDLSHVGGISSGRGVVMLLGPLGSEISGSITFSASVRLDAGKPVALVVDMNAIRAREPDHLLLLAATAILSRTAVAAYGAGW